ncbi:sulfhydryl oxidase 2 [Drosophila eugracilis]|uniref:sulfhydryl oxidase 2 n=1 Tax=Drosophila eugracilis TaxID=29029 RepID=UPI001BDB0233|nr:sulfhydryl oxidase 2 [Drosophila eugracilis]
MAIELLGWNRVLRIYIVDCAAEQVTVTICHDFKLERVPTLRYFPSNFIKSTSEVGSDVAAETLDPSEVVKELAGLLAKNDYSGTNELKPIFQPLQSNETKESIFNRYARRVSYILLVLEPPESQIGIKTVLDLLPYPDVAVRILKNEDLFTNFGLKSTDVGREVGAESLDPKDIVTELAGLLAKNDYSGTNELKPIFQPIQSNETKESIFNRYAGKVSYILLVLEPPESQIGIETVLDLLPYPDVAVRILKNEDLFTNFGLKPTGQKIALLDKSGNVQSLTISGQSRFDYVDSIAQFLQQKGHTSIPRLPTTKTPTMSMKKGRDNDILNKVLNSPPTVYQADLELAIYQIIHIEIPKAPLLIGYKLKALRHIMRVFNKYSPLRKNGKHLMESLVKYVKSNDEITGEQFMTKVNDAEKGPQKPFSATRYIGCVGSKPFARGITCSFWVLFHYLTVRAAEKRTYPPSSVIIGLYGFAKYFFFCAECAKHFQKMAKRRRIASVKTHDEEILWLWAAHNEVNKRLYGDATEDPKFPKMQFPQRKHCPSCYMTEPRKWNRAEVLKYLKRIYGSKNISSFGIPA